jgi:hypothetical protein
MLLNPNPTRPPQGMDGLGTAAQATALELGLLHLPRPCLICTSDTSALCKTVICTEAQGRGVGEGPPSFFLPHHFHLQGPAVKYQPLVTLTASWTGQRECRASPGPYTAQVQFLFSLASELPTVPYRASQPQAFLCLP